MHKYILCVLDGALVDQAYGPFESREAAEHWGRKEWEEEFDRPLDGIRFQVVELKTGQIFKR